MLHEYFSKARKEKGYKELKVIVVDLVEANSLKFGSTSIRQSILEKTSKSEEKLEYLKKS